MKYLNTCKGRFIARPNRFVARVRIDGQEESVHVKNTGRCKELLIPEAEVYLEDFQNRMGNRKMRYSLIGVKKGDLMINMDSQAPNRVVKEALQSGSLQLPEMGKPERIRAEKTYGNSRLDFYVEDQEGKKGFIEVKGVTLEEEKTARFPDAPTLRGIKHIEELIRAKEEGYCAYILFVIQMKGVLRFEPNDRTHREFGDALRRAKEAGVHLLAYDCRVVQDCLELEDPVEIRV